MTRINADIPPAKLCDKHLSGEYNEILRVVGLSQKRIESGKGLGGLPDTFRLGSGHVLFFYDKLKFIHIRFEQIKVEMAKRGWKPQVKFDMNQVHPSAYNWWTASKADNQLLIDRLIVKAPSKITYYGDVISIDDYEQLLNS